VCQSHPNLVGGQATDPPYVLKDRILIMSTFNYCRALRKYKCDPPALSPAHLASISLLCRYFSAIVHAYCGMPFARRAVRLSPPTVSVGGSHRNQTPRRRRSASYRAR
jgi:hypothetical protein